MKLLSGVVWTEGMYLGPHHFQAQSRYFQDAMQFSSSSLWYAPFGFMGVEMDGEAIRNGIISLLHAQGIFPDGLPFDMPQSDAIPEPRTIGDLFPPTTGHLDIFLAIPRLQDEGQNCTVENGHAASTRFVVQERPIADENTGRDERALQIGRKNIRLIVAQERNENDIALPLARVVRDASGRYTYDAAFIPPLLRIAASNALLSLTNRIIEILGEKSTQLGAERVTAKFKAGMSARDVSSFWFLHTVNSSLGVLRHLDLKRGHPEELFRELSRLAGALCTFGLGAHPKELPNYNHLDLEACFHALEEFIRKQLEIILPTQYVAIALQPAATYFWEGDVVDQRCLDVSRWVLGIRAKAAMGEIMARVPQLVKLCSAKFVPELVRRALPGLELTYMQVPPSAMPAKVEYMYFAVSKVGPCWEHISQTRRVGVYIPGEFANPDLELFAILEN
ncbi:MAG TPA: type VI secretion system baseplate subunit TssK [Candidatus Koribacter sp.]|jgi:type VI secretion system protein ImpJ